MNSKNDSLGDRFVLLRHELPSHADRDSHFDLMLEKKDGLLTWSLNDLPEIGDRLIGVRLPDHRKTYLDYEGRVSHDRGSVAQVFSGRYEMISESESQLQVKIYIRDIANECIESMVVEIEQVAVGQPCAIQFS